MVCVRCKMAVQSVLDAADIAFKRIELGWVQLQAEPSIDEQKQIEEGLRRYELTLLQDRSQIMIEKVKTEVQRILRGREPLHLKLSAHLSQVLGYNYTYMANTFSDMEGITFERYFIEQRVERVKEFIVYEDLALMQITEELGYSSVSHLCLQFKKVTGMTPAEFRKKCKAGNYIWKAI